MSPPVAATPPPGGLLTVAAPFLGFALSPDFKLKYLRLQSATGEFTVKLPKHLRGEAVRVLTAPVSLQLWLMPAGDRPGFKVQEFAILPTAVPPPMWPPSPTPVPTPKPVLAVCNRGSCRKRGSEALCQALQEAIAEGNAGDRLELRITGCLKGCKEGPTIELPDGTRKTGCQPGDARMLIAGLLETLQP
ncbi:MAG: (2Fe-2S) ferredoxin domain-containing protein [Pseudanabaenaceae cyanobacterium]